MQSRSNKLVEPIRLPQQIAKLLSEEIRQAKHLPGAHLPSEKQLSTTFMVSRPVIREAISILKYEGLVESRQGAGVFVTENPIASSFRIEYEPGAENTDDLAQLFQLRQYVETAAAELAADNAPQEIVHEMETALTEMTHCIRSGEGDGEDAIAADLKFHNAVSRASGNTYLYSFIEFINAKLRNSIQAGRQNSARHEGLPEKVLDEHKRILTAIQDRNAPAAKAAMEEHIKNSMARLKLVLRR